MISRFARPRPFTYPAAGDDTFCSRKRSPGGHLQSAQSDLQPARLLQKLLAAATGGQMGAADPVGAPLDQPAGQIGRSL